MGKLKKSQDLCLKKIEECEKELDILENDRWNPFDPIYNNYLDNYYRRNLDSISNVLRKLCNEYIFNNTRLYNSDHKGKFLILHLLITIRIIYNFFFFNRK